jgi:hypothetical protein
VSSVFLYLAIVAIWAFVLVPRWLKRHHSAPQWDYDANYAPGSGDYDADYAAEPADYEEQSDLPESESPGYDPSAPRPDEAAYAAADSYPEYAEQGAQTAGAPAGSRSRVLQTRRRLLTMLVLLAAAAVTCTVLKLTPWWLCIPPAAMLGMYVLLLREAAVADAERARWQADMDMRIWADRERAYQAAQEAEEQASAEIIDISGRVGDMLYDQYADATARAVGD